MEDTDLLDILEQTAERLSIKLDYDDLVKGVVNTPGGLFTLKGENRILIHKGLSVKDKVEALTSILASVDIDGVHLLPEVRERIEAARK